MKKRSTVKSAFFCLRTSIGLFVALAGVFLALFATANPSIGGLGFGGFTNASVQVNSNTESAKWGPLVWLEQKVTANDGTANSYFGSAAALNGSTALIGADGDNSFQGAAYLFAKSNGSWSEGQKLTASDGLPGDEFGYRVVLADNTLLVGAFTATVGGVVSQGAAYVFTQSNGTWSESQKLIASDGGLFDNFGASVALDGSTLVVGANGATVGSNPAQGAVYVFTESNGTWTQTQKLTANDGTAYDNFGLSVALKGSTILVGSPRAAIGANAGQGALYVFTESNGTWSQTQKLTASDGATNDSFGESVALEGSTALIGAYNATINGHTWQGAAYIFTESNGSWSEGQKLTASDGTAGANFGNAVTLNGSTALIGADASTVGSNTYQGKAYLFTESGGNWSQSDTFIASDGAVDDYFGAALAWDGTAALISTPHPTIGGNSWQGAAYFYEQSPIPTPTPTPTPTPNPTPTPSATPTPTPTPGAIQLSASERRVQGRHTVDLSWNGATSANIDVFRNGTLIATVSNTGTYTDSIGVRGGNVRYTYKVCEAATQNCSNEVIVRFGGPPL